MKYLANGLILILTTVGCASTPTGNIEAFANATKAVTDKIDNVIKEYNEEGISNELTKLAQRRKPITTSSLKPVERILLGKANKKKFALYKANHALGTYAEALSGLASSGSMDKIDLAASRLYGSLHDFNEQYKILADTTDNLVKDETNAGLGKIVAAIGGLYAAEKRGNAIREIVMEADPYIQTICDVIINELMKGVIEERLYTMKHTELSGYIKDYNARVASASFSEKREMLDNIYGKYLGMQSASASVIQAIKAIREVGNTHATLRKEVEKDRFSSDELTRDIGRLKDAGSHYNDLQAMMLSCDTELVADRNKGIICKEKSR